MNLLGNDGFNGKISNVYFYDHARLVSDTVDLYNKGPYFKDSILTMASKLQGSIKISVNVDVDVDY